MKGGYGQDALVQGGADAQFYALRRWSCLDSFVYFSHSLVTLPPPGWTNAAHTHGVRVLGTLITEWEAGAAACARLFGSAAAAVDTAQRLATLAAYFGFEGWLVNIENGMQPAHIPHLLLFLRELTARMREVAPGWSQVIWYDAVTTEGQLAWQDGLTPLNRPFFDACDALWVNYTWKEGTPARVAAEAGTRAADMYMGVDCFGRGTFGGGGFGCGSALRACLEQGLSAALFATGWPFEGDCGANAPACWRQRDALFWEGIEAAWRAGRCRGSNDGGSGGSGNGRASGCSSSRALPRPRLRRPLCTDFSHGAGPAFYQAGRCLSPKPWYNMSLQALQPLLHVRHFASNGSNGSGDGSDGGSPAVQASVADERAFSGGSSLRVSGHLAAAQRVAVQLFEPAACLPAGCVWQRQQ
ncbi:cytosolic endo-beta-N-acetylglucosaminidase-like [Micractinium conductrix]|uniref:Cytosolic endo-beta-N-acetylglucosaminidase-like n=1 Tax=Micractinium conductrix TaxID=554055 RepID=A0A2P6VE75_9CHLO|nr:cytosolic endo-beta-N-acetylglucosaminidase-like [Micractinium conductrix]|eukprot:PSC72394.1 cytosolic endo-beta-N-acetylglucosaminidase-like [Micractinium conductrix]